MRLRSAPCTPSDRADPRCAGVAVTTDDILHSHFTSLAAWQEQRGARPALTAAAAVGDEASSGAQHLTSSPGRAAVQAHILGVILDDLVASTRQEVRSCICHVPRHFGVCAPCLPIPTWPVAPRRAVQVQSGSCRCWYTVGATPAWSQCCLACRRHCARCWVTQTSLPRWAGDSENRGLQCHAPPTDQ